MSNKKTTFWQKLFGDAQTQPRASDLPDNDAFSVVTANLITRQGGVVAFSAVVPTVFSGVIHDSDSIDIGGGTAHEETILFAEELAHEQYPGSRWQDERQIDVRDATEQERQWALANGVNNGYGA